MSTRQISFHKGYTITTRCSGIAHDRFEASFTVFPPVGTDPGWQRFGQCSFASPEAATRDALGAAIALVDQDNPLD